MIFASKPYNNQVLTIILWTILKNFDGTIIMVPGRYDYHGFKIIAQPYPKAYHTTNSQGHSSSILSKGTNF